MSTDEKTLPKRGLPQVHRTPSGRAKVSKTDRAPSWHELVRPHEDDGRVAHPEPSQTVTFTTATTPHGLGTSRRERREAARAECEDPSPNLRSEEVYRDSLIQGRQRRRADAARRARRQRKGQRAFTRQQLEAGRRAETVAVLVEVCQRADLEGTPLRANAEVGLQRYYEQVSGRG